MSNSPSISRRLGKAITDKLNANANANATDNKEPETEVTLEGEADAGGMADQTEEVTTTHRGAAEAALAQRRVDQPGKEYELTTFMVGERQWYRIA